MTDNRTPQQMYSLTDAGAEEASQPSNASSAHIPLSRRVGMALAEAERDKQSFCETCGEWVASVNEADECEDCHDAWLQEKAPYWRMLYEGEKQAGLHGEYTEEGLEMRRRETLGTWLDGLSSWGSQEIAHYTRRKAE